MTSVEVCYNEKMPHLTFVEDAGLGITCSKNSPGKKTPGIYIYVYVYVYIYIYVNSIYIYMSFKTRSHCCDDYHLQLETGVIHIRYLLWGGRSGGGGLSSCNAHNIGL